MQCFLLCKMMHVGFEVKVVGFLKLMYHKNVCTKIPWAFYWWKELCLSACMIKTLSKSLLFSHVNVDFLGMLWTIYSQHFQEKYLFDFVEVVVWTNVVSTHNALSSLLYCLSNGIMGSLVCDWTLCGGEYLLKVSCIYMFVSTYHFILSCVIF
jgi:hypothetical protein